MKKIISALSLIILSLGSSITLAKERGLVVVSLGFGDDGVSKVVAGIIQAGDVVVRAQGAGFGTVLKMDNGKENVLYHVPAGILHPEVKCYLGADMVLDAPLFLKEIVDLKKNGITDLEDTLRISSGVHLIMPYHKKLDTLSRAAKDTRNGDIIRPGVRPCSAEKRFGVGIRLADLYTKDFPKLLKKAVERANETITKIYKSEPLDYKLILDEYNDYAKKFQPYVRDRVELKLNRLLAQKRGGPRVIFEGSHGTFMDVTHGSYPYVSSGSTIAAGICAGAGVGPTRIEHTLGVVRVYAVHPAKGPFPTEIKDEKLIEQFKKVTRKKNNEREVRYGWVDAVMVRQAILLNGVNSIALSRLDDLSTFDEIKMCINYKIDGEDFDYLPPIARDLDRVKPHYVTFKGWKCPIGHVRNFSELPEEARDFVKKLERVSGVPVTYVSVGPEREQLIEVVANLLPQGCGCSQVLSKKGCDAIHEKQTVKKPVVREEQAPKKQVVKTQAVKA